MIRDEILECKTHDRLEAFKRFQPDDFKRTRVYRSDSRLDVFQEKPGIVVAKAPAPFAGNAPCFRVLGVVFRHESRLRKAGQGPGDAAPLSNAKRGADVRRGFRAVGEAFEDGGGKIALAGHDITEHFVEIRAQERIRKKAQPPDVLERRKRRVDFLQISWNAARDGKDVQDFPRIDPRSGRAPETGAIGEGEFRDDNIERTAAEKGRIVDDVVPYPA